MEQSIYDEVRRKIADRDRDRFSVLIPDTELALAELCELVHDSGVWWNDGSPHEPVNAGRQRVRFIRLGTEADFETRR